MWPLRLGQIPPTRGTTIQSRLVNQEPIDYAAAGRELLLAEKRMKQMKGAAVMGAASAPPPPPPPDEEMPSEASNVSSSLPSIKVVKNDYNQHFVDTGERPQNFIRDHEPHLRFCEYPKLDRLIRLKDELNKQRAHPPMHIKADLRDFDWSSLGCTFDVILVDPPWKEYCERLASMLGVVTEDLTPWTVEDMIQYIRVDKIAELPSFCFLWCASQHLDDGRQLLQTWGYRRCEDICWLKTNRIGMERNVRTLSIVDEHGIFQHTKEHCLLGVKGVVRRSQDTHFIHSNIDTDIIVAEEPTDAQGRPSASTAKPNELYDIIERFCLGRKKIELFGCERNIRPGWVTIGQEICVTSFDKDRYLSWVSDERTSEDNISDLLKTCKEQQVYRGRYVGSSPEIDQLRPKSPPRITAASRIST